MDKSGKRLFSADQSLHARYVCCSIIGLATKTREWKIETEQHIGGKSPEMLASCGRGLVQAHKLLPWLQVLVHIAEADGNLLCATDLLTSIHYEGELQHR